MSLSEKLEAARVALGKRKERELAAAAGPAKADPGKKPAPSPAPAPAQAQKGESGSNNNKLLAGHLAHEFLAHGTLLGRRVDPSRGPGGPAAAPGPGPGPVADARGDNDLNRRYTEVSRVLMSGKARIPGIVNPTQLAQWLQLKKD